jgi:hypothetical protein
VKPSARIRTLVESGILRSAFRCLQDPTVKPSFSGGVYEALESLLPYMTLSKVHNAVAHRNNMELWDSAKGSMPNRARGIWTSYISIFEANRYAYSIRRDSHVNMCSNGKVRRDTHHGMG